MLFNENIDRLLTWHNLSQEELATKSYIPLDRVQAILKGEEALASEVVRVCRALGVSADRILTRVIRPMDTSKVKLLVLDVDGVMTSGGMYVMEDGNEMKRFHTRDGRGIRELRKTEISVAFLSGSFNGEAIRKRGERLGVKYVFSGRQPKTGVLENWMAELCIGYDQVAYIGDDLNDIEVIGLVGLSACPSDAAPAVKEKVDLILNTEGGQGCVREFIDDYLL